MDPPLGPIYPKLGPAVAKWRKVKNPTRAQRVEHATAIETAILALQRRELQRELPSFSPSCASGTWHAGYIDAQGRFRGDGKVGEAIRAQQRREILSYADKVRTARTLRTWLQLYCETMLDNGRWTDAQVTAFKKEYSQC